jgi:hypothetical protein
MNNNFNKSISNDISLDDSHKFHALAIKVTYVDSMGRVIPANPALHTFLIQVWDGSPIICIV